MKQLVKDIAEMLVSDPSSVEVKETTDGDTTLLELTVAKSDFGRIIGKQGHTIEAIRTIIASVCGRTGGRVVLAFDGFVKGRRTGV
jgi:uncharacterized protein